jgi:rubrerythrin
MQVRQATLHVLRHGIQNDLAGQRFYFDAASYCIDPWAKEVFVTLARRKEKQVRRLLAEYESVRDLKRWNGHGNGGSTRPTLDVTHLTFQEDEDVEGTLPFQLTAAQVVDRRSDDLQALALGIDVERSVLELYRQASLAAKDREVKKAYEFLLRDKSRHYRRLRDQWKELAGAPFDESGSRIPDRVPREPATG